MYHFTYRKYTRYMFVRIYRINSCKILTCISEPDMLHLTHQAYIFLYLQFKQSYILIINLRNLMLIQIGNTKEQGILRKARFSCQKGENYGEFNEGAEKSQGHAVPDAVQHKGESAESVQCSESFALYRSERIGDCDAEKCCIYEYEKRSGIFAGYAVKLI